MSFKFIWVTLTQKDLGNTMIWSKLALRVKVDLGVMARETDFVVTQGHKTDTSSQN